MLIKTGIFLLLFFIFKIQDSFYDVLTLEDVCLRKILGQTKNEKIENLQICSPNLLHFSGLVQLIRGTTVGFGNKSIFLTM